MPARKLSTNPVAGQALAELCAHYADAKQAEDVLILDLRGISQLTDFFVICSGGSPPHLRAIRDEIRDKLLEEHGAKPNHHEGVLESNWVVLDFIDVMVHVFHRDTRAHYDLERLWSDAKRIEAPASRG